MATIKVDISGIKELQKDIEQITEVSLRRLAERGYQLLRKEIKETAYRTGNLLQGVAPPDFDFANKRAELTVSARSARRGARQATLHLKNGKTKKIQLRATPEFNYAETVARGRPAIRAKTAKALLIPVKSATVARGRPAIRAKTAKALLIPVKSAPSGETYIEADGQIYIVRASAKAVKANPFDERAANQLQKESTIIVENVMKDFGF